MRIVGVLSSGGDAPGINACLRAIVRTSLHHGLQVIGIREGFDGLVRGEMTPPLTARDVGGILQRGGTFLQTARCPEFIETRSQIQALRELNESGIEGLIVIGGDGSMRGAHALASRGFPVIGVPASIDNDIWGTDMALGVDTALNTIMEAVDKLRDTASSHQRAFLVETMGRDSGYLALEAGLICGAEIILIPERDVPMEEITSAITDAYARGKSHAIAMIAEGAALHPQEVAEYLAKQDVGFETRVTILGHVPRGGSPSAFDRLLATRLGVKAVAALIAGQSDIMLGLDGRQIVAVSLEQVISSQRELDLADFETARMLAR